MIFGAGIAGLHRAVSNLLLLVLLLVSNAPLLSTLASLQADCGTKCCRSKKTCCCRKEASATQTKPTASVSARTCPSGCCQFTAIVPVSLAHVGAALAYTLHIPGAVHSAPALLLTLVALTLCFALFQRPPPALQIATE